MYVCTHTNNGMVIGHAGTEQEAVDVLRRWTAQMGVAPPVGAKVMPAQINQFFYDIEGNCEFTVAGAWDYPVFRAHDNRFINEAWVAVTEPADVLAAIGRDLFGEGWQAKLAREIGINENTIGRWLSGKTRLPEDHGVFLDLADIYRRRAQTGVALQRWIDQITK